jgi:hypothetical protein
LLKGNVLNQHVINIYFHTLISRSSILHVKRHSSIVKNLFICYKYYLIFIIICICIWWYPELASRELMYSNLVVEFINLSIFSCVKLSLKHALLRLMNFTHIHHFPFDFLTITMFINYSRYITSQIKPTFNNLSIFFKIAFCLSPLNFLFLLLY